MALTTIPLGAVAKSSVLNDNFIYLDEKISSFATNTSNKVDALSNSLTTISGNLSGTSTTVSNLSASITDLETSVEGKAKKDLSDVSLSSEFKELILSCIAPDYKAGYSISSDFIAPSAGWIACYGTSGEGSHTAWYVDGAEVFRDDQGWGGGRAGGQGSRSMAFIEKGSVVTRSGNNNNAMFYPCKGVQ